MKIFVTGGSGILGSDILRKSEEFDHSIVSYSSSTINIADPGDVNKKVKHFNPDVIIHCAAMTNVDLCEDQREMAYSINVIGTRNLATAASNSGIRMVYISSCGVYGNGKQIPYTEIDNTNPINYHHITKLEGEKEIRRQLNDYIIIRPGWLFGGTQDHKKNFVEARRKEALQNPLIKSAVDKMGSPTYTGDVANQIIKLINSDVVGIFNVVNEEHATRFEYVSEILKLLKADVQMVEVNSNEFPRKATLPDNEMLDNYNLKSKGLNFMRPWREALKDYINTTYNI